MLARPGGEFGGGPEPNLMDWTAFSLSLKLAFATCVLIMPPAIFSARALAWGNFQGKSLVEAAILLPLVLPPTVLGYYLLMGFAPGSFTGGLLTRLFGGPLVFSFAGILIASLIVNLPFAVLPLQRAFEAIPRQRPGSGLGERTVELGHVSPDRAAAGVAGYRVGPGVDLRAHARGIRRGSDDRRQHPW